MNNYDDPFDFYDDFYSYGSGEDDDEEESEGEEDKEWELLNIKWQREEDLVNEIGELSFDEETDIDELRNIITKLVREKYAYLYSEDMNNKPKTFISLIKYLESPERSVEELMEYLDVNDKYVRNAIASNAKCNSEMLAELKNRDDDSSYFIANNPNCSRETLADINEYESTLGRIAVALNPNASEKTLINLSNVNSTYCKLVLKNPSCTEKVFETIICNHIHYYPYLSPYVLVHKNCPDYLKCYLIDRFINEDEDLVSYLNTKIREGMFSQIVIDFLANSDIKDRLNEKTKEYIELNKSGNKNIYEELFKDILVGKEYPKNTLNFKALNGHYEYSEEYKNYYGVVGKPIFVFDYFGDSGLTVISRIRELGTNNVVFGESPISLLTDVEWWAFKKAMERGLATKTGNTYRNILGYFNTLYTYDEYDYNGFKVGVAEGSSRKIEPLTWELGFNYFVCKSELYDVKNCPKELAESIPSFLEEDLINVEPQSMEEDGQLKLKL